MIKPKSVSNFLIGIDEDQKNIYIFDEITEKETLLFSIQNSKKRIGAVEIMDNGKMFVAL